MFKINDYRKRQGFTLIELIVILVILAVIATILVPARLGYIDKSKDADRIVKGQMGENIKCIKKTSELSLVFFSADNRS